MANTDQSKKRPASPRSAMPSTRRAVRIRTFLRKVEEAIASGDQPLPPGAEERPAGTGRGVTKGVLQEHRLAQCRGCRRG